MEILIAAGAWLNCICSRDRRPPLIEAILHDKPRIKIVRLLIQGGARLDITYDYFKETTSLTPLKCAIMKGHGEIIEMLLKAECSWPQDFDLNEETGCKLTDEMYKNIEDHFSQPISLKRTCRRFIRNRLGRGGKYSKKICRLDIPETLKGFMQFDELSHYGRTKYSLCNKTSGPIESISNNKQSDESDSEQN